MPSSSASRSCSGGVSDGPMPVPIETDQEAAGAAAHGGLRRMYQLVSCFRGDHIGASRPPASGRSGSRWPRGRPCEAVPGALGSGSPSTVEESRDRAAVRGGSARPGDPSIGAAGGVERLRDADRTRADILAVATREFADRGLRRRPDQRDRRQDQHHQADDLLLLRRQGAALRRRPGAGLQPASAAWSSSSTSSTSTRSRRSGSWPALTFDHHESHPDFIRLVSIENIHRAEHIARSTVLSGLANPAVDVLGTHPPAGLGRRRLPRRRRRPRRAPGHQRLLRLPDRRTGTPSARSSAGTCSTPPAASTSGRCSATSSSPT